MLLPLLVQTLSRLVHQRGLPELEPLQRNRISALNFRIPRAAGVDRKISARGERRIARVPRGNAQHPRQDRSPALGLQRPLHDGFRTHARPSLALPPFIPNIYPREKSAWMHFPPVHVCSRDRNDRATRVASPSSAMKFHLVTCVSIDTRHVDTRLTVCCRARRVGRGEMALVRARRSR